MSLTIEERAKLMVKCQCHNCRPVTSWLDANLRQTVRAHVGAQWALRNPLEAAARRGGR